MTTAPILTPIASRRTIGKAERWGWIYQRVSGLILIVLVFTHLFSSLIMGEGISQVDFGFVAGKWADALWQWWDFALLILALTHGGNGMRMIINDYAHGRYMPHILQWALRIAVVGLAVLGTLVIFTFDPCPTGVDPTILPSFCADL